MFRNKSTTPISWKLFKKLPAPCCHVDGKAASERCRVILNRHISSLSISTGAERVTVLQAEPVKREAGTVLPCGWILHLKIPPSCVKHMRAQSIAAKVGQCVKNLRLPLITQRQVTDYFDVSTRRYKNVNICVDIISEINLEAKVMIAADCSCLVDRYLLHFLATF